MEDNKSDIGWGSQIRSYVLDDSRIKIRVPGWKPATPVRVLDGSLGPLIEASLKAGLARNQHVRNKYRAGRGNWT